MGNYSVVVNTRRGREKDSLNPESLREVAVNSWNRQIGRVCQVIGERGEVDGVVRNDMILEYGFDDDFQNSLAPFLVRVLIVERFDFVQKIECVGVVHGAGENLVYISNLWPCDGLAVRILMVRTAQRFVGGCEESQARSK